MKTIKQWLKERLSKEDYKKAKQYKDEDWKKETESFEDALSNAFTWLDTPECHFYWDTIHNNGGSIDTDPNTPEIKVRVGTTIFEYELKQQSKWIKIESEKDLPKKEIDVHFIFTDETGKYQTFGVWDNKLKSFYSGALKIENVIYYQPLIKPLPPKF